MTYGFLFSLLAVAIGATAFRYGPWTWFLLYPAFSFAVVGVAYFTGNPSVFGKGGDGQRTKLGTLLVGPYVAYVAAVWHGVRWCSRETAFNRLGDDLILSRRLLANELPDDVASVVDLTCEFTEPVCHWKIDSYFCYPMLDASAPSSTEIRMLAEKILQMPKPVLIHCAQGHGRTGLVASALLCVSGRAQSASDAIAMVQSVRPGIDLNVKQRSILYGI